MENKNISILEKKFIKEASLFLSYFIFLAFFFSIFTLYDNLIMDSHIIDYNHYIYSLVEALVLAKIILIGQNFKLGERFSNKPLFFSTLYKTVIFCCFVIIFSTVEHFIIGLIHGKNFVEIYQVFLSKGINIILARTLVMFFVFIFFFAFLEIGRVIGNRRLLRLFFKKV